MSSRTSLTIRTVEDAANVVADGAVVAVKLVQAIQVNLREKGSRMDELASNGNPMIVKFSGAIAFRLIKKKRKKQQQKNLLLRLSHLASNDDVGSMGMEWYVNYLP